MLKPRIDDAFATKSSELIVTLRAGPRRTHSPPTKAQYRADPGAARTTQRGKVKDSKHIEILYVDRPQFATLLLPLTSTGFYPDGNSPKKPWKIAENGTLKWGSSPPPSRGGS